MINKADFRIQELKDYITKSETKNVEFRNRTDESMESLRGEMGDLRGEFKKDLAEILKEIKNISN